VPPAIRAASLKELEQRCVELWFWRRVLSSNPPPTRVGLIACFGEDHRAALATIDQPRVSWRAAERDGVWFADFSQRVDCIGTCR